MDITRLYTGTDGESHFEKIKIDLNDAGQIGRLSDPEKATGIIFRENSADYNYDWHNAPQRQYIIMLEGIVEVEVGSGEKRMFHPGDILLVEDTSGRGHVSRALGDKPRKSVFVTLE